MALKLSEIKEGSFFGIGGQRTGYYTIEVGPVRMKVGYGTLRRVSESMALIVYDARCGRVSSDECLVREWKIFRKSELRTKFENWCKEAKVTENQVRVDLTLRVNACYVEVSLERILSGCSHSEPVSVTDLLQFAAEADRLLAL